MAIAKRRTLIANPARRNKARKKMSAKQIKHFGTKRQKAALKAKRRHAPARKRNPPKGGGRVISGYGSTVMNPRRRKRRNGGNHKIVINPSSHRRRTTRRRTVKRNVGEVVSLLLGNPATKGNKSMARTKRRRTHRNSAPRRTRRVANRSRHIRHNRRNPMGGAFGADVVEVLYMIGGGVGSKLLSQMVLSTSNTGLMGYAANLAAGAVLAFGVKSLMHNPKAAASIFKGAVLQVVLRAIADYTPFGTYTSQLGMGDYMASNWVTPQRYVDGLNSAQVQIPGGWAPTQVIASSGVNANAMGAGSDGTGIY